MNLLRARWEVGTRDSKQTSPNKLLKGFWVKKELFSHLIDVTPCLWTDRNNTGGRDKNVQTA